MFLLEYFSFFFTHGDWKGTFIYACPVCHMWGLPEHGNLRKHQSSSTIWVFRWLQLISHIVTVLLQVKQTPCVKRPFFSPTSNPAASQSYGQLVHRGLLPSCPEIPRVTLTARCLLQVTDRAPAVSGTVADRGKPSTPKDSVWLF